MRPGRIQGRRAGDRGVEKLDHTAERVLSGRRPFASLLAEGKREAVVAFGVARSAAPAVLAELDVLHGEVGARDAALVLDAEGEGPHGAEDAFHALVVRRRRVEVERLCGRGLTGLGAARPGGVGVAEELVSAAAGALTGREGADRPRLVQRR